MPPLLAQRQRPDRAFERLYRRYVGDVYRYAFAVMRNQPDAEDVTQTTFMNAYRAFQRGERPEKPRNWLIAIAHNVCRQRFRQSARRPVEVAFDDDVAASLVESDAAPTGDDIRRALGHLAFSQRAALVMRELEGRSYAEIADTLELSTGAVETLIFRARRALREQLETTLTCSEAERAISKQLDGRLSRSAKGALRAHLRECPDCATFARRQRAQRAALRSLATIPVPPWLGSLFGGGGASVGSGLALKAAVAVTAGVAIGGAGYVGVHEAGTRHHHTPTDVSSPVRQAPSTGRRSSAVRNSATSAPEIGRSIRSDRRGQTKSTRTESKRHKRHVRGHRKSVALRAAHSHARSLHVARLSRAHGRAARVKPSHRRAVPPRRTKPRPVLRSTSVVHTRRPAHPASGNGTHSANGHGK